MNQPITSKWIVDLNNLTCYNLENHMVIVFVKKGSAFVGKIKDIPVDLAEKWTREANGDKHLRNVVIEADEVFFKAFFNREIEKKCSEAGLP